MTTMPESLAAAIEHHQHGRLQEAERIYCRLFEADPNPADALHLFGLVAHQTGRHDVALEHICRAVDLNPHVAFFHGNLGSVYRALGKLGVRPS